MLIGALSGCLSEQSFEMGSDERASLNASVAADDVRSTRRWIRKAHEELSDLMPASSSPALLTEDLVSSNGAPIDVYAHFGLRADRMHTLLGNLGGIRCTAQCASQDYAIDTPAAPWEGFDDAWIPIEPRLSLSGRLGFARDANGEVVDGDCIVILPGFFGDNGVTRTKDMAIFLRQCGFHVLALELRGHGQTERRYPNMTHTFGVMETDDLLQVSDWLTAMDHVRRTGLIGYCWGANIALLAAWYEASGDKDPSITPSLAEHLRSSRGPRRFTAGVIAYSPILRWEVMVDKLDTPRSYLGDPVHAAIQRTVKERMERKGYDAPSGSLRKLIDDEYRAQDVRLPNGSSEGSTFLRIMPYKDKPWHSKLSAVRSPLLVVHGADDPLSPSQYVADFAAMVDNPNVAAIVLPGGGHVGFAAYCKAYYYSLIAAFFDPSTGAAAVEKVSG